jgi:hypothetical protein
VLALLNRRELCCSLAEESRFVHVPGWNLADSSLGDRTVHGPLVEMPRIWFPKKIYRTICNKRCTRTLSQL